MVKKKMADGSDCRKCAEVTEFLRTRGLLESHRRGRLGAGGRPGSPGMVLGARLGVERAPFFIVRDESGEKVYTSVLQLIQERLGGTVTTRSGRATWTRTTSEESERGDYFCTLPACRPHSFIVSSSHHQRPSRSCWPGLIGRVHGSQPIETKPRSWSAL